MKEKKVKAHCSKCGPFTNCQVLHFEKNEYDDPEYGDWGYNLYQILQCEGCEKIFFREESSYSEDQDNEGRPIVREKVFPKVYLRTEPEILNRWSFNGEIDFNKKPYHRLFKEIYIALNNDAPSLAAMGIRSLIERMVIDKVGDHGTFARNLNEFKKEGHISERQQTVLSKVLELGHAVTHRKYRPTLEELNLILDIVENIYVLAFWGDKLATSATRRIPAHKKKKSSKK